METKISVIKEELQAASYKELPLFISKYETDERSGVAALVKKARKQIDDYEKELLRTEGMKEYEKKYGEYSYICGIDEVGRGPLAGPVVAGAVILPMDCDILYLNDIILEKAVATGIGVVSPERIDEINILQATYEAMRQAIGNLSVKPDLLLNDAVTIPKVEIPQVPIIKGDAKSISIAAASIIAKVYRDRLMVQYDDIFPGYGFAGNKGYGSQAHMDAIRTLGPTPIHRRSFIKNV